MSRLPNTLLAASALVALAVAPLQHAAAQVVTGNIYEILNDAGADRGSTIDYWYFHVNSAGVVTIDTLSWELDSDDYDVDGDFDETVDVNSDGEIAFIDPYIYLFHDDGSLDIGDLIAANDDDFINTYGDGSIYGYDSYLSQLLAAGDYVLAIGAFFLSAQEAVDGFNNEAFYPISADGFGDFIGTSHGDYQITFTGDLRITGSRLGVPEPASIAILSSALLASLAARRRR